MRQREPRTIKLERVARYLLGTKNQPDKPSAFTVAARAFRQRWGLPVDGFMVTDIERWPDIARTVHEFWLAFSHWQRGTATQAEQWLVKLAGSDPYLRLRSPELRDELAADGYDLAWFGWLVEPNEKPNPTEYWQELRHFTAEWVNCFRSISDLKCDAPDLILDLIYNPSIILERLKREHRWFDLLRDPTLSIAPYLHTFTAILPDATINMVPGTTPATILQAHRDERTGELAFDEVTGKPFYQESELQAVGFVKPLDVFIHTRAGISWAAVRSLVEEVTQAIRNGEGLFADLDPRDVANANTHRRNKARWFIDKTVLVDYLARIHSGESRAEVVKEIVEGTRGQLNNLGAEAVYKALRDLEKEGFQDQRHQDSPELLTD